MRFTETLDYPADVDAVFAMLTDERYLREKLTALGHGRVRELTVTPDDAGGVRIDTIRDVPTTAPAPLRPFVPPTSTVRQLDEWAAAAGDGTRSGTWRVEVSGVPVDPRGTVRLARHGGGSRVTIEGEITSSVPILGRKLASFAVANVSRALRDEHTFACRWLAGASA